MGNGKFFVLQKTLSFRNEDAWGNLWVSKQSDLFPNAFGRLVYTNITYNQYIPSLKLTAASLHLKVDSYLHFTAGILRRGANLQLMGPTCQPLIRTSCKIPAPFSEKAFFVWE